MFKPFFPKMFTSGPLFQFDLFFLKQRQKFDIPVLNKVFQWVSIVDEKYISMFIIYSSIYYFLDNKYDMFQFILLVTLSDQICKRLIKDRFKRHRPYRYLTENEGKNHVFWKKFHGYTKKARSSMCSSHAANFLAQGLLIAQLTPALSIYILPFFVFVGISRWFVGAHWVSDILVGWTIGILSVWIHVEYIYPFIITLI